jgi:2-methylisocitrate lyase-like PEP mutase family enzyme
MTHYQTFYELHHQPTPFLLANAWNAKSARLIQAAGFKAIGTSSGAIADSMGYADGEQIPFEELFYIIQRIEASTDLPLSVDFERGYSDELSNINTHIQQLLDVGVVGINLEDAQGEDIYLHKLQGIKNYLAKTNQQLFINARTDVYLQKLPSPFETVIRRAGLYRDAGADGLFVTGIGDATVIKQISSAVSLPVNVVGNPQIASVEALANAGVKRISMAVFPYRATYSHLEQAITQVNTSQSLAPLF